MIEVWKNILGFHPLDNDLYNHTFEKFFIPQPNVEMEKNEKLQLLKHKYQMQRLELLGDAILQMSITEKLFHEFPLAQPGPLTRLRSRLVRNETLVNIVKKMKLIEKIQSTHPQKDDDQFDLHNFSLKIYADFFESLIGCIYLDKGWEFAKAWVISIYKKYNIQQQLLIDDNYIDLLQQVTRSNLPTFHSITVDKKTTITCEFNNKTYKQEGLHKPAVKQAVAKKILEELIEKGTISNNIFNFKEK
jgi:dsRNA-specific ribonuclease